MLLASPCSTPQPLSHGIVQYRLALILVTPVLGLDLALYDLACTFSKEETVFALVHAFAGRLVVDFLLGELLFACHGVL